LKEYPGPGGERVTGNHRIKSVKGCKSSKGVKKTSGKKRMFVNPARPLVIEKKRRGSARFLRDRLGMGVSERGVGLGGSQGRGEMNGSAEGRKQRGSTPAQKKTVANT